ncbi:MFS transporter [Amycolatopsis rhizosphaerae]|uniref:MFS transporter n=1 Tax=Amycolatopsis rhizosphaerae TaxID=2053003 RepID=A0A558CAX9_9PSEU|nr:MFS transporter [Amycolatopsis rhizosphaerae]TVT45941.1 MFS transporter [Amycolatopsis rhizosphaerae]
MSTTEDRRWLMLPVILAAFFMYGFDGNVVNVTIPSLQADLGAGEAALELVVGAYVFTYAAGLVLGGRLGDLFGYRRMFLFGMTSFTVASVLCGLAQNSTELVIFRMLQGLTAAGMVPQVLALIMAAFTPEQRPRALLWFGVTGGLSGVCGQVLGGLLLVSNLFDLGWRVIFFVNVPVGVVVLAFALRLLPTATSGRRPSLDGIGVLGISGSLALALVPLVLGRQTGWPVWAWALLVASVPAMTAALLWERRVARTGGRPLLDLTLFRSKVFNAGLAINAAFMAFFTSYLFCLSLLLQSGLRFSALHAGLIFAPTAVFAMVASLSGKRLVAKHGLRVLTIGSLITAVSVLIVAAGLQIQGGGISQAVLLVSTALMGIGNGLILPSLIGAPMAGVKPDQAGIASGMLSTTQQFASVTGIAVLGALFFAKLGDHPGRAAYAPAAELAAWVALGIILVMAALVRVLLRAAAASAAEVERETPDLVPARA